MRITQSTIARGYQYNIDNIRERYYTEQMKLISGRNFQAPTDAPRDVGIVKRLTNSIERNDQYKKNIDDALTDNRNYEAALDNFANRLESVRDIALDASKQINFDKLPVLGNAINQVLGDLVEIANYEYDGRFAFSGTRTTRSSITPTPPQTNQLPFELVKDPAAVSTSNPEGLTIAFKGNSEARLVATSNNTSERVNVVPSDAFGAGGTQVFEEIIAVYNTLMYKADGTERTNTDALTTEEMESMQESVKKLSDSLDRLGSTRGSLGATNNRLEVLSEQITFENLRLKDLRSAREDTDVAEATKNLVREDSALNYALKVGGQYNQQSLIDFLG